MARRPWLKPFARLGDLVTIRRSHRIGEAPGALRDAPPDRGPGVVRSIAYGPGGMEQLEPTPEAALAARGPNRVVWIDVIGAHDSVLLASLGEALSLHPLALEDAQNTHQRAKVDEYDDHDFMTLRFVHTEPAWATEQLSVFLCDGIVVTIQEDEQDCFDEVRKRIAAGNHRISRHGADYLAYALVDAVVDHYFPALEVLGDRLEALEERVLHQPSEDLVAELHILRRKLLAFRKAVWPLRDALSTLVREDRDRVGEQTRLFFRDVYDHAVQALEVVESFRELASSLLDLYLSSVSHRMNDTMKVLTIITTIFVPLSFLAGLYGMNFDTSKPGNLPELSAPYGYVVLLGVMGVLALCMLAGFWRMGWLGGSSSAPIPDEPG